MRRELKQELSQFGSDLVVTLVIAGICFVLVLVLLGMNP